MKLKRMEAKRITIGDYSFTIRPLSAMVSTYVFGDVVSVILPIIGTAAIANGKEKEAIAMPMFENVSLDTESLAHSLAGVDGKTMVKLVKELCLNSGNVSIPDEQSGWKVMDEDDFGEIFCMYMAGELKLCAEIIMQNYGNFFKDAGPLFGGLIKKAPPEQQKSSASLTASA